MKKIPAIKIVTEGKPRKTVPNLARRYETADDLRLYGGKHCLDDNIVGSLRNGDVEVPPVSTRGNGKEVPEADDLLGPLMSYYCAHYNQILHDHGIAYERHNKGVPMLQICDLRLQCGSEDHVECSWKLNQVTKEECKLEIDQSSKNEQGKKVVKFCFLTNDTDKELSHVVDGYEVKYMLRTDAIRLKLELEIELSSPNPVQGIDLDSVRGDIKLKIQHHVKPYAIDLLDDQRPTKKQKIDHNGNPCKISIIRNVPRGLCPYMKLAVKLKDKSGVLDVDVCNSIFSYNIPVDQEGYFYFKGGCIKFKAFWGCSSCDGQGLCTGVCTCEPAEFIGFCSLGDACCINGEELLDA